ncbi:MAG: dipeptide/oligopeptide/nickel ABC transporter ATP-binding protein [Phycisphaerales bacterium]|jgi:peptide/nickel transport system ATP-binding protein/oligopeptide transport system ATP-binding protein|nr:dipeptide/oligopeptide/nickel ABC transporter ATP-binding protein [Phycisphaerales bacterium]
MDKKIPLLEIRNLNVTFPMGTKKITAVDDVSFAIARGTTVGIVGRSGSGKSTLARAVMQIAPINTGQIVFDGTDLCSLSPRELRSTRKRIQMVFQDPGGSLNEFMRVGKIIGEPLLVHGLAKGKNLKYRVEGLLEKVGLKSNDAEKYPHEFSGGQKQRIAVARAISLKPDLLVCDEPTSALDVSIQKRILDLLSELRDKLNLTIMFISHDLAVVNEFCNEVVVMSNGKIIESGCVNDVVNNPQHEITNELIKASQDWNLSDSPSRIL